MRRPRLYSSRKALALVYLALTGCGIGESGIAPPNDRIFFPASVTVDQSGGWLFVVNSNSDLRYNAGTLVAVDLAKAAAHRRARDNWPRCQRNTFLPEAGAPRENCCRDFLDDRILNCDERGYVETAATVRTGSFGGSMIGQTYVRDGQTIQRLYVAVRAEPSITVVDAVVRGGRMTLRCSAEGEANAICADDWKITEGGSPEAPVDFPEEPSGMSLDPKLGLLYVGHLSTFSARSTSLGGISVIDVCAPQVVGPRLASVTTSVFPGTQIHAVNALTVPLPGDPAGSVFATARFTSDVGELRLGGAEPIDCSAGQVPPGPRDVTLVTRGGFIASPLGARQADLRGLAFSPDRSFAYVLHRQYETAGVYNPSIVLMMDRRLDARGEPVNRALDLLEVCRGPTRLRLHDAGRGPRLFVNCFEGGQLYVIEPGTFTVQAISEVGHGPADLEFSPADPTVAFVAAFADNSVAVIDLRPGSPTEFRVIQRLGFPHPSTLRPKE